MLARAAVAALALLRFRAEGQEVQVNDPSLATGWEDNGSVAASDVGFHFAWDGSGQCYAVPTLQMRQVDSQGRFLTAQQSDCPPFAGPIAALPSGIHALTHTGNDVWVRLYDALGAPISSSIKVDQDPYTPIYPDVAALPPDRFVIAWGYDKAGEIHGRILMQDGSMPAGQVTIFAGVPQTPYGMRVATLGNGHVVVCWQDNDNYPSILSYRILDSSLALLTQDFTVATGWVGSNGLGAGGSHFGIAWTDAQGYDVWFKLYDETLGALTPDILLASGNTVFVSDVKVDETGRTVVVGGTNAATTGQADIVAWRFDAAGAAQGPPQIMLNMNEAVGQYAPHIGMRPSGDFMLQFDSTAVVFGDYNQVMRRFFYPLSLLLGEGPGPGNPPRVRELRPDGRIKWPAITPYGSTDYGCSVGAGDIDGGGKSEMLTGPGPSPSYGPHVRAFRPDGSPISKVSFYAYGTLRYGVRPAGGSIDPDAYAEILTAPGPGAIFGPHVRAFDYDNATLRAIGKVSFFAYSTLKYGARVAAGDIDGDSYRELLTAPGPGAAFSPQVRGFDYDGSSIASMGKVSFDAWAGPRYGATVSAADIESGYDGQSGVLRYGDGYQEIVAGIGPDPAWTGQVRLFDYDASAIAQKYEVTAYSSAYGCNVAGGDVDAGDIEEIATAPGPDPSAPARAICWEWNPVLGYNPAGPQLLPIPWDDFTAFAGQGYGANIAVGAFE